MSLEKEFEHDGTDYKIDFDELQRYGEHFIAKDRGLIIRAMIYTQGTKDSRSVRDIEVGTDYTFSPVEVDVNTVQESIKNELDIEITDEEANRIAAQYQQHGVEALSHFATELSGDRILSRTDYGLVSLEVREPYVGWKNEFGDIIAHGESLGYDTRTVIQIIVHAAQDASPGDGDYNARIELIDTEE